MKKYLLIPLLILLMSIGFAQTKPKAKAPPLSEMDKAMEEAMKGMSEQEKAEMRKMMKSVMPEMAKKPGAAVVAFTDNKKLIPAKDVSRINSISKKIFTEADVSSNTALLYSKLIIKIPTSEKTIITTVLAKATNSSSIMEAAIISFMQGHGQAAMGLALKAVQADPKNVNHQNNLAAILSQSGYPEKAIPYLKKLSAQFPSNSTVLHNLGYAWFSLGEIDTASKLFSFADARNPQNPETKIIRGVIEESKGDNSKAADFYVESFELAPNPFTENLVKNVKAEGRLEKIDFEKLKSRIAIHQYFKKDWIQVPAFNDYVSAFEENMKIKNGYSNMFTELNTKIELMADASSAGLAALADEGFSAFNDTLLRENRRGANMMSMPAVYVQKILLAHIHKWNDDYTQEANDLMAKLDARQTEMTKTGKNDKCPDIDKKNNQFLSYANPLIREFYTKKIEEFRTWLNAFCTWSWYITGNPKNTVLTQCIAWTGYIIKMYEAAMENQYVIAKACVNQESDNVTNMNVPVIPNFTCPAVVSIPIGLDELQLTADAINFDKNDWNIKKAPNSASPNQTQSYGTDKHVIAEPGKYGTPSAKTGNESIATSGIGNDEPLTPLSKISDELTPLSKIPPELSPLDPSLLTTPKDLITREYEKARNAKLAREILKEMMKVKCPGGLPEKKARKTKFEVGLGKLTLLGPGGEELKTMVGAGGEKKYYYVNEKGEYVFEDDFTVGLGKLNLLGPGGEEMQTMVGAGGEEKYYYVNEKGEHVFEDGFTVGLGKLEFEEIETNGLQTSINNGLEATGRVKNFIKGLFN